MENSPPDAFDVDTFLDQLLSDQDHPVVMFETRWCGYCRAARQLFEKLGVPYHSIDLGADAWRDVRPQLRNRLRQRTGSGTVPQVFIGGRFIGGATETIAAYRNGSLQERLKAAGVNVADGTDQDNGPVTAPAGFPF